MGQEVVGRNEAMGGWMEVSNEMMEIEVQEMGEAVLVLLSMDTSEM